MKYMLMGYEIDGGWGRVPDAEMHRRVNLHVRSLEKLVSDRARGDGRSLILSSFGLAPAATTVRMRGDSPLVTDGPFAETKELLAGFEIVDFASQDDAFTFVRECFTHDGHVTEIRPVHDMWWIDLGGKAKFVLLLVNDERLAASRTPQQIDANVRHHQRVGWEYCTQNGALGARKLAWLGARLRPRAEAAMFRIAGGKHVLADGPFAETKEVVGGVIGLDCESRDEAVEWAKKLAAFAGETVEVHAVDASWTIYHG